MASRVSSPPPGPGAKPYASLEHARGVVRIAFGEDLDDSAMEGILERARSARQSRTQDGQARLLLDLRRVTPGPRLAAQSRAIFEATRPTEVSCWVDACARELTLEATGVKVGVFDSADEASIPEWVRDGFVRERRSLHFIAGATGAGKSTYARALAHEIGGFYFGTDPWMHRLYWADRPSEAPHRWYMERIERIEGQMWDLVTRGLQLGVPSVLDLGLTTREHRARLISWARAADLPFRLHYVDAPRSMRWARVLKRNAEGPGDPEKEVTRPMFDFIESIFEAPLPDEVEDIVQVWTL